MLLLLYCCIDTDYSSGFQLGSKCKGGVRDALGCPAYPTCPFTLRLINVFKWYYTLSNIGG